jgi:hypothetical protein
MLNRCGREGAEAMIVAALLAAGFIARPPGLVAPGEGQAFQEMLKYSAASAAARFSGAGCPRAAVVEVRSEPVRIQSSPSAPAAREKVEISGCGRTIVENLNVVRTGGAPPWRMLARLPGESLAEYDLQQNTWPAAVRQAQAGLPETCAATIGAVSIGANPGHVRVADSGAPAHRQADKLTVALTSDLQAIRSSLAIDRAWLEVWPLRLCGHDRKSGVLFIPTRDGRTTRLLFFPLWKGGRSDHPPPG